MKAQTIAKKILVFVLMITLVATIFIWNFVTNVDSTLASAPTTKKSGDIYVTPNGKGTGTSSSPTDLVTAIKNIKPGNTIWMQAGTYTYSTTIMINESNSGTASAKKTIAPLSGKVVLDFSSMSLSSSNRGIVLDGSYWHIYGLTIKGAGDNGILLSGDNNIIEMCVFKENRDTGLQISRYQSSYNTIPQWPTNNLVKNCTSYNNCDSTGENADGFAAKLTCGEGNVFDGCMAYNNSDDGWDLYAKTETGPIGVVTIKNCVAFRNGKLTTGAGTAQGDMNGFKLGGSGVGTPHVVENCIAFENGAHGFVDNNNPTAITLKNCTSFDNSKYESKKANFTMYRAKNGVYSNLLTVKKSSTLGSDSFVGTIDNSVYYNSSFYYVSGKTTIAKGDKKGTVKSVSSSDFVSLTAPGTSTDFHTVWRNSDGSINTKGFLEVAGSSPYATMASDGKALGARLSATVVKEPETEKETEKETVKETESESTKENESEEQSSVVAEDESSTADMTESNEAESVIESSVASENKTDEADTEEKEQQADEENQTESVTAESKEMQSYAGDDTDNNNDNDKNGSNIIWIITIGLFAIAGGIGGYIGYKRKVGSND